MPDSVGSRDGSQDISRLGLFMLLAAIFAAAGCAIVYELLIGAVSSYFLGDSVEQFSITIGCFLFAMGLGSWVSRLIEGHLIERFVGLEIALGLVGGLTVPTLYLAYAYTQQFRFVQIAIIIIIGSLIGLELPLLTRILRGGGSLRTILANVMSLDYFGSLVAALLFPYLLLPLLGAFHTSLVTGLLNTAIGLLLLVAVRSQVRPVMGGVLGSGGVLILVILAALLVNASSLQERWEASLYAETVVHSEQTRYQKVVLTEWQDEVRLYLDGHLQFSSVDEYRYHESLVQPAMALTRSRERVLVIGGGDGLAVREVLKYPDVLEVELVDIDAAVTKLARRDLRLTAINENALNYPKVRIFNEDAFAFLQQSHQPYGVIILDLPDPRFEALTKLYSVEGYRLCMRHLAMGGVVVTQATSPYYARRAYWTIAATLETAGFKVFPYHAYVPSFGEWGFHLAVRQNIDPTQITLPVLGRFFEESMFEQMLRFPADMERVAAEPNRMDRPHIARVYREDWGAW
jgi:spermidine synthase